MSEVLAAPERADAVPQADSPGPVAQVSRPSGRMESLDAFRGLTILVMVFVNDVAGVRGIPDWMRHAPTTFDGMTFVDLVFPSFLFIVGMSIPFALGRRLDRGESIASVAAHILVRTLGLLAVGVLMVNLGEYSARLTGMSRGLYTFLLFTGVILTWNLYPKVIGSRKWLFTGLRWAGAVLLIVLAVLYRGQIGDEVVRIRPQWWGILGLIGWAYLTAAMVFLALRRQFAAVVGVLALLVILFIGNKGGAFSAFPWLTAYVNPGPVIGSHGALAVAGMLVGMLFLPGSPASTPGRRIRWMAGFGVALMLAGFWLRPLYGISKDLATPAWVLLCSAISCGVFACLYWLMDVIGRKRWAAFLRPAGENPLLAYILPTWLLSGLGLVGFDLYRYTWNTYPMGVVRSALFALAILGLTGLLGRIGIRLRL